MNRLSPWASLSLSILIYSAIFVMRRELALFAWSGTLDWIMLVIFAFAPAVVHRDKPVPYLAGMVLVAAVAEIVVTILIVALVYRDAL